MDNKKNSNSKKHHQNSSQDVKLLFEKVSEFLVKETEEISERDIDYLITTLRYKINSQKSATKKDDPLIKDVVKDQISTASKNVQFQGSQTNNKQSKWYKKYCNSSKAISAENVRYGYCKRQKSFQPNNDGNFNANKEIGFNEEEYMKTIPKKKEILTVTPNLRCVSQDRSAKLTNFASKAENRFGFNISPKLPFFTRESRKSMYLAENNCTSDPKTSGNDLNIKFIEDHYSKPTRKETSRVRSKWNVEDNINYGINPASHTEITTSNFLKDRNLLFNKVCDIIIEAEGKNEDVIEEVALIFKSMMRTKANKIKSKNKINNSFNMLIPEMPKWALKAQINNTSLVGVRKELVHVIKKVGEYIEHEKGQIQKNDLQEFILILRNKMSEETKKFIDNEQKTVTKTTETPSKIPQKEISRKSEISLAKPELQKDNVFRFKNSSPYKQTNSTVEPKSIYRLVPKMSLQTVIAEGIKSIQYMKKMKDAIVNDFHKKSKHTEKCKNLVGSPINFRDITCKKILSHERIEFGSQIPRTCNKNNEENETEREKRALRRRFSSVPSRIPIYRKNTHTETERNNECEEQRGSISNNALQRNVEEEITPTMKITLSASPSKVKHPTKISNQEGGVPTRKDGANICRRLETSKTFIICKSNENSDQRRAKYLQEKKQKLEEITEFNTNQENAKNSKIPVIRCKQKLAEK